MWTHAEPVRAPWPIRAVTLLGCLGALLIGFFGLLRPWYLNWGADRNLQRARLPGDELLWEGAPHETLAIEIAAPAAQVWPWVAQIGQDRAGFYSFEILENLVGCEMKNLDIVIPALGRWAPGDRLWLYPREKAGGVGQAPLARHDPGRALVFYTRRPTTSPADPPEGTWAFIVQPIDGAHARFIVRGRAQGGPGLLGRAFESSVFEPLHFVMERKMMEGVKARAEGRTVSRAADDAQVALWLATFAALVASAVAVLRGRAWPRHVITFTAAGALFALLTLGQPSLLVSVPLVAALWGAIGAARVPGPRRFSPAADHR